MRRFKRARLAAGGGLLASAVAAANACGGDTVARQAAPTTPRAVSAPAPVPAIRHVIPDATRVPSPRLLDRRARSALAPNTLASVRAVTTVPRRLSDAYRQVAPAIVVVETPNGIASGVLVDPAGWVLTNQHVVAQGIPQDFTMKVGVRLGELSARGARMQLGAQVYDAYVHKVDALHDLALVKMVDPPGSLPTVQFAEQDPVPGQQVIALGHGGAGLLWSARGGEVVGLSQMSEHLGAMVRFSDDAQGRDAARRFASYLEDQRLGLVIQTTAELLPGTSGGPLVDENGRLLGINGYSELDAKTGEFVNFHAHRAAVATFVADRPEARAVLVPDPWQAGGGDAAFEDADGDGAVDVLVLEGRGPCRFCARQSMALFVDVDQDSFADVTQVPSLPEVFARRAFDAEMVFLRAEQGSMVWYDTDNDGDFDVLLLDPGSTGRSSRAYRIRADRQLESYSTLARGALVRLSLFGGAGLRQRLAPMARTLFPQDFVEATTGWQEVLPHPLGHAGRAVVVDLNHDGTNDAIQVNSPFAERLLADVDQSWVPALAGRFELGDVIRGADVDVEMAVVSQGTHMWVWYDTDDDQRFDLVLRSADSRLYVATEAFRVEAPEGLTPVPEHVGRKLVRPDLLTPESLAAGLRSMVAKRSFLELMSAADDRGLATFPDPIADHRGTGFIRLELPPASGSALCVQGQGSDGYLLDLDGNGIAAKSSNQADLGQAVKDGGFDPEFAYFHRNGLSWAYYDTDRTEGYDVVLYSARPELGKAQAGYRVSHSGEVRLDPELAGGPLIRPSLLSQPGPKRRLQRLGALLFKASMLESHS